jgi:hypothetical protein
MSGFVEYRHENYIFCVIDEYIAVYQETRRGKYALYALT